MRLTRNIFRIFFLISVLCLSSIFGNVDDDETPEVTARVARISFLRGDVQVRHADSQDWERATNNLPIVEGDEINADSNARLEVQFDSRNYLRLAENGYLKVTTLRDEGIALSLPNGFASTAFRKRFETPIMFTEPLKSATYAPPLVIVEPVIILTNSAASNIPLFRLKL